MENTKTPMKDKETKEKFYRLFKMALNQAVSGEEMRDGEKDGLEELINYVSKLEQEAERRGEKRYGISLSEKADKPYIVIDDMKQGGKTIFAGTLEHIQINKLLEEENGKQE